jgi:predicted ribosome quality control (RQC) complex YloA/Tae2 family protein
MIISKNFCLILSAACILFSCGSNETTITSKDGKVEIDNIMGAGQKMKENLETYQSKREERRKKGDTLSMHYKELEKYLPEIEGYEKKTEPKGETVNMPGFGGWSTTKQEYKGPGGTIKVELSDYNQSANGFTMAAAVFGMNMQVENDREKSGSFDTGIPEVKGYEKLIKKSGRITLLYAISDRFFLQINGRDGVSADDLKKVAGSMPLAELAAK